MVDFEFVSVADVIEWTGPAHQCPWAAVCEAVVPEPEVVATAAAATARDEATKACIGATSVRFIGIQSGEVLLRACPGRVHKRQPPFAGRGNPISVNIPSTAGACTRGRVP